MLFMEIIAVYCQNHTEHINTLCGQLQSSVRTSQETHYVSGTKPNRLMLFIARTIRNTQIHCVGRMQNSSYIPPDDAASIYHQIVR
jgi:hypothetical protein